MKNLYIHIGGDIVVREIDVIAILDVNHLKRDSKKNYSFEDEVKKYKEVVKITNNDVKSFVITDKKIYYSPISSLTLKKRAELMFKL